MFLASWSSNFNYGVSRVQTQARVSLFYQFFHQIVSALSIPTAMVQTMAVPFVLNTSSLFDYRGVVRGNMFQSYRAAYNSMSSNLLLSTYVGLNNGNVGGFSYSPPVNTLYEAYSWFSINPGFYRFIPVTNWTTGEGDISKRIDVPYPDPFDVYYYAARDCTETVCWSQTYGYPNDRITLWLTAVYPIRSSPSQMIGYVALDINAHTFTKSLSNSNKIAESDETLSSFVWETQTGNIVAGIMTILMHTYVLQRFAQWYQCI